MTTRQVLMRSEALVGLVHDLRKLHPHAAAPSSPDLLAERYLELAREGKLHIGAGPVVLPGWLNTDISPTSNCVMYLDATQPFPFKDGTFSYVFSEHMIEHVSWSQGLFMLDECHRVLRP